MLKPREESVPGPPKKNHSLHDLTEVFKLTKHRSSTCTHQGYPSSTLKIRVSATTTKEECASTNLQAKVLKGHDKSLRYNKRWKVICEHVPGTLLAPGKLTDASTMPPVKQNLFQLESIPLT